MPKKKSAPKPSKSFEESLWETATKLRGSVESTKLDTVIKDNLKGLGYGK
tara:strand:+ start:540 stop:689 length:150 start_codon:yes stop_codon:yes gene_type:complete